MCYYIIIENDKNDGNNNILSNFDTNIENSNVIDI